MSDEDKVHGYCLDCGKRMSDKWMYNNPFAQQGSPPSCPTCGGVIAVMHQDHAQNEITKNQNQRGIGRETRATTKDWEDAGEQPQ